MSQPKPGPSRTPKWSVQPATDGSTRFVNSVAISDDASHVVAGTYFHNYNRGPGHDPNGRFGTYCYDSNGNQIWKDEFDGYEGVYTVGIAGNGQIAAAGGWFTHNQGLLRAYSATTGKTLLNYGQIPNRVSSLGLSRDGSVLVAAADKIYIFTRSQLSFPNPPATIDFANTNVPTAVVAVHADGTWLAACDQGGNVCLATIGNGKVLKSYNWKAPQPVPVPFLSVAIASDSESFVVGGGDVIYLFTKDSMIKNNGPVAQYDTPNGNTKQDVRWVAISGDGTFVTAVENNGLAKTGLLDAVKYSGGKLVPAWQQPLTYNPNSTSVDLAAKYVAAADGYPENSPGNFYLFEAKSGKELWNYSTTNMNWPLVISANGMGIAAGSDNGSLYYFQP